MAVFDDTIKTYDEPHSAKDLRCLFSDCKNREIGRAGVTAKTINEDLENGGREVINQFHSPVHAYHYFILCAKNSNDYSGANA